MKKIIVLPERIRKNGFDYFLIKAGRRAKIYRQESDSINYFEVFQTKIAQEKNICGKIIPAQEKFPHNESFGFSAWVYPTFEQAEKKFQKLEKINNNEKK